MVGRAPAGRPRAVRQRSRGIQQAAGLDRIEQERDALLPTTRRSPATTERNALTNIGASLCTDGDSAAMTR
jgi:hypothetical protein